MADEINFWGVVHVTRAFLPHLTRRREAHIVNLSSIFGIVGTADRRPTPRRNSGARFSESLRTNCR